VVMEYKVRMENKSVVSMVGGILYIYIYKNMYIYIHIYLYLLQAMKCGHIKHACA